MKKIKFAGKLSLNKETIAKLNDEQMSKVNGGSLTLHCTTTCPKTEYMCGPATETCATVDTCFTGGTCGC